MNPTHQITVNVMAASPSQADEKGKHLTEISRHIDLENLKILADAAKKPGINQRIQQFKMFI